MMNLNDFVWSLNYSKKNTPNVLSTKINLKNTNQQNIRRILPVLQMDRK